MRLLFSYQTFHFILFFSFCFSLSLSFHFGITISNLPTQTAGLLFHRAMLLSGTGLSPWSLVNDPAKYAAIISHHVNCSPDLPYSQLMKCLREQSLDELLSTPIHQPDYGNAFGPSVDGVVIGKFNCWIIHWQEKLQTNTFLVPKTDQMEQMKIKKDRTRDGQYVRTYNDECRKIKKKNYGQKASHRHKQPHEYGALTMRNR